LGDRQLYVLRQKLAKRTFILGTDSQGRDILSRLIVGTRVSLSVGLCAALLALSLGLLSGILSGYFKGWPDTIITYIINVLTAIPDFLLVFALVLLMGSGLLQIALAIGLVMCISAARLIRNQILFTRELGYIQSARLIGLSDTRIIFRHILPNIAAPLMGITASTFAAAIILEAGVSFLGIGIQPPTPSWGLMIREHFHFLRTSSPILSFIPGLAIVLLALAFNVLGSALKEIGEDSKRAVRIA
jgi:ABC-type dipeptide/oligopeptide/nickel transport system permease subunit